MKYKFFANNKENRQPQDGEIVFYQLILKNSLDSVILDTKKEFGEQQITITPSSFKGDLMEGIKLAHKGDSLLLLIPVDSLYKNALPFFAQPHTNMKFYVKLNDVMTQNEFTTYQNIMRYNSMTKDDAELQSYFRRINKMPLKLPCGAYIFKVNPGVGDTLKPMDTIKVNYIGKLINGHVFDSNLDAKFSHVEPFKFVLGKGEVIKGWDECLMSMRRGGRATIYIPSALAYGRKQVGTIPANSILIFDIDVLEK